jgi:hypothetical protein
MHGLCLGPCYHLSETPFSSFTFPFPFALATLFRLLRDWSGFILEITMPTPLDPLVAEVVNQLDADLREDFEERAGIIEFDGNLPRAHAECLALLNLLLRHPECLLALTEQKINKDGN